MEGKESVEKKGAREPRAGKKKQRRYPFEVRLRAVRLVLQEGFSHELVCQETGVSSSTLSAWLRDYRAHGEAGLQGETAPRPGRRLPAAVTEKILQLKRANRWHGVKRIADTLRRLFFLPASPETVRRRLQEAGLMDRPPKARRNLTRPRFFERASPNQMWQSDLFTFRLGGKYAYVVAFLDDYSRYVVGLDLYRSPTAEAVIETYRVAAGEYSPPKEMLTDRGRQYTSWRGKSRFAAELQKDRVAHIVSRPQHPMTLGKVERFWATMWQEFLVRAQFDSFESARERLRLWVKYYNHRRPHQGIGAMCPADRYFEIASDLRKTIQAGIQDNLLEMALRGQPKSPFYLVGRLDGQSVVLQAEKGKLKLSVDEKEMTYELEKRSDDHGGDETREAAPAAARHPDPLPGGGEGAGGPGGLDGPGETGRGDADDGRVLPHAPAVAGTGDGGHAAGPGSPREPDGRGGLEPTAQGAPAEAPAGGRPGEADGAAGAAAGGCARGLPRLECLNHADETRGPGAGGGDPQGARGVDDGDGGGDGSRGLAENLLRVGGTRPGGDAAPVGGPDAGPAGGGGVGGGDSARGPGDRARVEVEGRGADGGDPGRPPGDGGSGR